MANQQSFNVIIEDITDPDPMGAIKIPTRDIQKALIELGIGKIKPMGGMVPHSRYSKGDPRKYFMSVIVYFENTIDKDLRKSIEQGNSIILKYTKDEDNTHNRCNIQEENITIKKCAC